MNHFRLGLGLAGFVTAVLAITIDDRRVVWIAIGLLSASFLLRILQRKVPREHSKDKPDTPS
jgi:hypothetical protein